MLQRELFALLEQTADAAYTVTSDGQICSWNKSAARLFGYQSSEVLGSHADDVLEACDAVGTRPLAPGAGTMMRPSNGTCDGVWIPNVDLEVRTRSGSRVWVNVSTLVFDDRRTGRRLFVRLVHNVAQTRRNEELLSRLLQAARQLLSLAGDASRLPPVKPLSEQEHRILRLLASGNNATTIAGRLSISTQTLRNHLHHINRKLRTHNHLEAVTHAQRRGIIE